MHRRILGLVLSVLVLACPAPAFSQTTQNSVYWEELTWTEIGDAIKAGKTTIIIPTGAIEDKGPHMAVNAHSITVQYAASEIAKRLGNTLVAPTMSYTPNGEIGPQPTGHMRMMGSTTLPTDVFSKVVEWTARSFKHHGMKDIVIIFDSGGNRAGITAAADLLNKEWAGTGTRVHVATDYYGSTAAYEEWLKKQGETDEAIGQQGGITQTSEIMVINPQLLRREKFAMGGPREMEGSGVTGDPRRASVKYGKQALEMKIDAAFKQITALMAVR